MFKVDKMPKQWIGKGSLYYDEETGYCVKSACGIALDGRTIYLLGTDSQDDSRPYVCMCFGSSQTSAALDTYNKIKITLERFSYIYKEKGVYGAMTRR